MKTTLLRFALILSHLGPCAVLSAATPLVIKNGGMAQGEDLPDEWGGKFGEVDAIRDVQTFQKAPASLRVTATGGKNGNAFQKFDGGAGAKFRIAGWMKSKGSVKAQAAVQAFSEGFKQNQFIQLQFLQDDNDWIQFEKEVELPVWTAFFNVLLMAEGEGSAWLDEVRDASVEVDSGVAKTADERMASSAAPKGKPWEAGWGFYPQHPTAWQLHFKSQLERTKQGGAKIVFLGDSITQGWGDTGKAAWAKHFEPNGSVNYGIGGDSTRQVLWRIENGLLDGLSPKLVVVKIGTNNLYDDGNAGSDEDIARGVEAVVKAVFAKLPTTRVLLLGILPRQNDWFSGRIAKINATISKLDDGGKKVRFLDLGTRFQKTLGKGDVIEDLFDADKLHLSAKGYEMLADAIAPTVGELVR